MTPFPRLGVSDPQGQRTVDLDKPDFLIGRGDTANLRISSLEVSRRHARIVRRANAYFLCDCGSRGGTFVNGETLAGERRLEHGDRVRLGRTDIEVVFLTEDQTTGGLRTAVSGVSDLRQMTSILNGLRAVGSGRVLDEVLTLVLDEALEVTGADRGFIMLPTPAGELQFQIGRTEDGRALAGQPSDPSRIAREVFETGQSRIVKDLQHDSRANKHDVTIARGIGHVLCVPLVVAPFAARPTDQLDRRVIGVLYLDGRDRARMVSSTTRATLEAFGTQAALAIESARLYAEAEEKTRIERELRVAADIQRALLPPEPWSDDRFDIAGTTIPCRTVGGDFFDYLELPGGELGFALGDVAGKGAPAALLAAAVQSNFVAQAPIASSPADLMARLNSALLRRAIAARFATMCFGVVTANGEIRHANAGQEPPIVVRAGGVTSSLEAGGPVLGLLDTATFDFDTDSLAKGDLVVLCSDGITEARNEAGDEYGRERLLAMSARAHGMAPERVLNELLASIHAFAGAAPQVDDITALVLRYRG